MKRLAAVSPQMRPRLGALVDAFGSVICDCGLEFVARHDAVARCPGCGRTDTPVPQHIARSVAATMVASAALDQHLGAASGAAKEKLMANHKVSGLARLVAGLRDVHDGAGSLADELMFHKNRVVAEMAKTRSTIGELKAAGDELESANAIFSNGGPELDAEREPTSPGSATTDGLVRGEPVRKVEG